MEMISKLEGKIRHKKRTGLQRRTTTRINAKIVERAAKRKDRRRERMLIICGEGGKNVQKRNRT